MKVENFLEDCPLCRLLAEDNFETVGTHCAVANYEGNKTVLLLRHVAEHTTEEILEAMKFMGFQNVIWSDLDVPGHWAISSKVGNWESGKSKSHDTDPGAR